MSWEWDPMAVHSPSLPTSVTPRCSLETARAAGRAAGLTDLASEEHKPRRNPPWGLNRGDETDVFGWVAALLEAKDQAKAAFLQAE